MLAVWFTWKSLDESYEKNFKDNIPYNLAKKIVVFVSDGDQTLLRLQQLREWLIRCNYPQKLIDKGFHDAKLQGPAPAPKDKMENKMIFVSKYVNNFTHDNTVSYIDNALKNTKSERINKAFEGCSTMIAYKQPQNLLRLLTRASFSTPSPIPQNPKPNGLFRCKRPNCKLCRLYIQECSSFVTSNGKTWEIRSHVTCHSINALYYLKCLWCPETYETETYTGKTEVIRDRMNNHISSCKLGTGTNEFNKHVYGCRKKHSESAEPWFHIYVFFTIKDPSLLESYERYLHRLSLDTMNRPT